MHACMHANAYCSSRACAALRGASPSRHTVTVTVKTAPVSRQADPTQAYGWLALSLSPRRESQAVGQLQLRMKTERKPNRFLYLIRSNSYFLVRLYCFRFRILDVSYFKCKSRKRFRHFSTVFYFSTFNLKYFEFKIWFKPNLVHCTVTQPNYRLFIMHLHSFYWWLPAFLLAINWLFLFMCGLLY